jgi:hypothetical protein
VAIHEACHVAVAAAAFGLEVYAAAARPEPVVRFARGQDRRRQMLVHLAGYQGEWMYAGRRYPACYADLGTDDLEKATALATVIDPADPAAVLDQARAEARSLLVDRWPLVTCIANDLDRLGELTGDAVAAWLQTFADTGLNTWDSVAS